jgi:hypothetical protein
MGLDEICPRLGNCTDSQALAAVERSGYTFRLLAGGSRAGHSVEHRLRNAGLPEARARLDALANGGDGQPMSCVSSTNGSLQTRNETLMPISNEAPGRLDALLKAWRTGDDSEVRNWQTIEVPSLTGLQSLPPLSAVTEILDPDQSISRESIKILSIDLVEPKGSEYRVTVSANLLKSSPCISDPYSDDGAVICFQHNINQAVIKSFYYDVKEGCINRFWPVIFVS